MARAKRTDRAEARRRYRAAVAEQEGAAEPGATPPTTTAGTATALRKPAASAGPTARPGILSAFRVAMAPADIRSDLRYLPTLALHTRAIWLPAVLVVAGMVIGVAGDVAHNGLSRLVVQTVLLPPAMIPAFIAGILTTRASWLAGGITGIVASIGFVLTVSVIALPRPDGTASVPTSAELGSYAAGALANLPMGFLVGALAGFYRRLLRATSPARPAGQRRRPASGRARGR